MAMSSGFQTMGKIRSLMFPMLGIVGMVASIGNGAGNSCQVGSRRKGQIGVKGFCGFRWRRTRQLRSTEPFRSCTSSIAKIPRLHPTRGLLGLVRRVHRDERQPNLTTFVTLTTDQKKGVGGLCHPNKQQALVTRHPFEARQATSGWT